MSVSAATIPGLLREGARLIGSASDSARLDAELLLAHVLGRSRNDLHVRASETVEETAREAFATLALRRAGGEPVAYLVGQRGFWTFDLDVSPDVLVPRPDTECLVTWALECVPDAGEGARIADLGTGSGAIAIALALERPKATVIATDRSRAALSIARANAARLCPGRITFLAGDWFEALGEDGAPFDLIASNPPYVAQGDPHLAALVHEPRQALVSGVDGLDAIRTIVAEAPARLGSGGWLLVEHGYDQGARVRDLFTRAGFVDVGTRRDFGGVERVTGGRRP